MTTAYCPHCGEREIHKRDLSLHGLLLKVGEIFTNVDGRAIGSFRALLVRPGSLTAAFLKGQRKPFIGPFQIFLIANVVFFAVQSVANMQIFSNSLDFRLHGQLGSEIARTLVDEHLAATGLSFAEYAPVFDNAIATNAKSLIGLMVPLLALILPVVFLRAARPVAVHVVFALHFYAFVLLLFCVPLAALSFDSAMGGTGVMSPWTDDVTSIGLLVICAAYLYVAIGPAYGARGFARAAQALLLTIAAVLVFFAYRFVLLPITLYTT